MEQLARSLVVVDQNFSQNFLAFSICHPVSRGAIELADVDGLILFDFEA